MDRRRCVRVQQHLCLLLFLSQLVQWGQADVLVEAQSGPLYRVIGYPISISCNVTGFSKKEEQEFRFFFYQAQNPDRENNIISTSDENFAYASYGKRVRSKDITVERLSDTSVVFHIKDLRDTDDGVYECHTPNTEATYLGMYFAKTTVKVIEDTLTASSPGPASLSFSEGDALSLQCHASSSTFQHTHLSVTWYLHGEAEASPRPVISLDRDLTLSPGAGFEGRYQSGLIGLEKVGEASYRLKMAQLEVSDAGRIYCQVREWIQDPDRSWYAIAQKDAEKITVAVKAKEVAPVQGSMLVHISVQKAELTEGEELRVRCSAEVQGQAGRFVSLAWVRDGQEMARIGPTGVLTVHPLYSDRESSGELKAKRTGERDQLLTLRPTRAQDGGVYLCRAWSEERDGGGVFTKGINQDSIAQPVGISAIESGLSVAMETKSMSVNEGNRLQLVCRVTGVKGHLSVTWQRRAASAATGPFSDVIALTQEGVSEAGEGFGQRGVRALRPASGTFTMELSDVTSEDAGTYRCTVSEWNAEAGGGADKSHSQSQEGNVAVTSVDSFLKVKLTSRDTRLTEGGSTELVCRVQGPRLPITVTWILQRPGAASPDTILTVAHNNDITWLGGGDQSNYQLKTTTADERDVRYVLRITRASLLEAGQYRCVISPFLQKIHKKQQSSNALGVSVTRPGSRLSLAVSPSHMEPRVDTDIVMKCSAVAVTSNSSLLAVTWLVEGEGAAGNQSVLVSDRNGVVTPGTWAGLGTEKRISMRRGEGRSFEMTIRKARIVDSGRYYCLVEEWLQDPHGQWYTLSTTSTVIELQVQQTVSDFRVNKTDLQLQVREGQEAELNCILTSGASDPTHLYALTWYHVGSSPSTPRVVLVQLERSGVLRYPENQENLQGRRLRFSRPSESSFRLGLGGASLGDSGTYLCQVDQYKLNPQGHWEMRASDTSGTTNLTVKPIVSRLSLAVSPSHMEPRVNTDITMKCSAVMVTSNSSLLAVTWLVELEGAGGNQSVFISDRNGVVTPGTWAGLGTEKRISMRRGEGRSFELTIRKARFGDSGRYYSVVEEWLQDPHGQWYTLSTTSTVIELQVQQTVSDFRVNKTDLQLQVREGQEAELNCILTSGASDPTHLYALTWYHVGSSPFTPRVVLVQLERSGVLRYPENQENIQGRRLRFSRPSENSFRLGLGGASLGDSGTYLCQVDQYQLNPQGNWEMRASDTSGTTNLTVKPIESNLQVLKLDGYLNLTATQATNFSMSCDITSRTSQLSELQVTWFWRQEEAEGEGGTAIFTAQRNSTLQDLSGRGHRLRFGRPRTSLYTLASTAATASDSGVYYCEVEEWLQSPSLDWRRVAWDRSGQLTVSVHAAAGHVSEAQCSSGTLLGIFIPVLVVLVAGVMLLAWMLKTGKGQARNKKQGDSLWAEQNPLKGLPVDSA